MTGLGLGAIRDRCAVQVPFCVAGEKQGEGGQKSRQRPWSPAEIPTGQLERDSALQKRVLHQSEIGGRGHIHWGFSVGGRWPEVRACTTAASGLKCEGSSCQLLQVGRRPLWLGAELAPPRLTVIGAAVRQHPGDGIPPGAVGTDSTSQAQILQRRPRHGSVLELRLQGGEANLALECGAVGNLEVARHLHKAPVAVRLCCQQEGAILRTSPSSTACGGVVLPPQPQTLVAVDGTVVGGEVVGHRVPVRRIGRRQCQEHGPLGGR